MGQAGRDSLLFGEGFSDTVKAVEAAKKMAVFSLCPRLPPTKNERRPSSFRSGTWRYAHRAAPKPRRSGGTLPRLVLLRRLLRTGSRLVRRSCRPGEFWRVVCVFFWPRFGVCSCLCRASYRPCRRLIISPRGFLSLLHRKSRLFCQKEPLNLCVPHCGQFVSPVFVVP